MTGPERKLTAILAADVAGYSRLMGADEEGTLARLKAHRRELIDPTIAGHRGRIVKTTGDGMLVEFASVVDAVKCAVEIQKAMREREADLASNQLIQFRIGVNTGDVIIDGDDIHGDGVNVAARLEALAEPGTICVSGGAWDQVRGKVAVTADDLGEKKLKNIERVVRVYRIASEVMPSERPALPLPDKPSIAVLPFQNISGDPEQEYFADGMVEEIITALSRFHGFFVIARNSSFTYKGRAVDVKQVARELGVRYVLEGSVRKAGAKVRITGQLIDASNGAHIWADRFDGDLSDVFELQDQITTTVVGAITPKLRQAEMERARRKPTESLDAYDLYLRALPHIDARTIEGNREALRFLTLASQKDDRFALAHAAAASCYATRKSYGWLENPDVERVESLRLTRIALDIDQDDGEVLTHAALAIRAFANDLQESRSLLDRALSLNSNSARTWGVSGLIHIGLGNTRVGIEHCERALRISPFDTQKFISQSLIGIAHFFDERFDQAIECLNQSIRSQPKHPANFAFLAASFANQGRLDQARIALQRRLDLEPTLTLSILRKRTVTYRPEHLQLYFEGLRKAGLPE